jgi:GT2 family glycosyltransferase
MEKRVPESSLNVDRAPLIDIILPYFEGHEHLKECVSSVLAQTESNLRLTVIDDGNDDPRTQKFLVELHDPRVVYIKNYKNLGISRNFEKSRKLISAKWGMILGHDDRLHPGYLDEVLKKAEKYSSAGVIQPKVEVIGANGSQITTLVDTIKKILRRITIVVARRRISNSSDTLVQPDLALKMLLIGDFLYFPTIVWRNEHLQSHAFRTDLEVTMDIELLAKLFESGSGLLLIKTRLAQYRRHDKSKSGNPKQKLSRLTEEKNLYRELSRTLNGGRTVRALATLHLSTRGYCLLESCRAITRLKFRLSIKYLSLCLF